MLSFENVLDCFALVIQTGICEVLLTRHGYVVMEWDEEEREWFNVTHCDTPEALREAILSAYEGYEANLAQIHRSLKSLDIKYCSF